MQLRTYLQHKLWVVPHRQSSICLLSSSRICQLLDCKPSIVLPCTKSAQLASLAQHPEQGITRLLLNTESQRIRAATCSSTVELAMGTCIRKDEEVPPLPPPGLTVFALTIVRAGAARRHVPTG